VVHPNAVEAVSSLGAALTASENNHPGIIPPTPENTNTAASLIATGVVGGV